MEQALILLERTRMSMLKTLDEFSEAQLYRIPEGFGNNIVWNFGHLVVSQQFLTYDLAGLPMNVSEDWIERFIEGSSPKNWAGKVDLEELREASLRLVVKTQEDWQAGVFADVSQMKTQFPYKTSFGGELNSVREALHYNNYHEGVHYGTIRALRLFVRG